MPPLHSLSDALSRAVFADLRGLLPPIATDTPEARASREALAMEALAALDPADAFEADLAVQIVGFAAHAKDCMRLAAQPGRTEDDVRRCRAQALAMGRQAQAGIRLLERRQARRAKAEAAMHPPTMERAGYWFRAVEPSEPKVEPKVEPKLEQQPQRREASDMTRGELYAVNYPRRAALIRAHGGLPARIDFGAPEPDIVEELLTSTSPLIREVDQYAPVAAAE